MNKKFEPSDEEEKKGCRKKKDNSFERMTPMVLRLIQNHIYNFQKTLGTTKYVKTEIKLMQAMSH